MTTVDKWRIAQPSLAAVRAEHARPLDALADGTIPAIVLKGVFSEQACDQLINRLIGEDLLFDPRQSAPEKFKELAIPEGFYREGVKSEPTYAWKADDSAGRTRIDIGTSLGYRGSNQDEFFEHSRETQELFARLFSERENPVALLYDHLQELSVDKRAVTAYEPDGRKYGPAIIRAHYGGYTYKPHFDSVRLREKRDDYAVHSFEHQFAGVLVLQNTQLEDQSAQCVLHHCLWNPDIEPHLQADTFHDFARDTGIENVEVCLQPGDLYFFNTRLIHEVPGVAGLLPRIVLATFIGYSKDRDETFVWS